MTTWKAPIGAGSGSFRRPGFLVQAPGGELVLVPSEVMPELVQVGEARLLAARGLVALREIPEVGRVEIDPGGLAPRIRGAVGAPREEAENIGLESLGEEVGPRTRLEPDRDLPGHREDLRRELALGRRDDLGRQADEPRPLHRDSVERSTLSNLPPRNQSPTAASAARMSTVAIVARTTPVLTPRNQYDA